jgi:hypothetical protein
MPLFRGVSLMMNPLAVAAVLTIFNERIIEYVARPLKLQYPDWPWHLLLYISLVTGAVIGWLSGVNLFSGLIESLSLGRFMRALCIGAGSSFLHEMVGSRGELVSLEVEGDAISRESPVVQTTVVSDKSTT